MILQVWFFVARCDQQKTSLGERRTTAPVRTSSWNSGFLDREVPSQGGTAAALTATGSRPACVHGAASVIPAPHQARQPMVLLPLLQCGGLASRSTRNALLARRDAKPMSTGSAPAAEKRRFSPRRDSLHHILTGNRGQIGRGNAPQFIPCRQLNRVQPNRLIGKSRFEHIPYESRVAE